jgi:hypothetical protein
MDNWQEEVEHIHKGFLKEFSKTLDLEEAKEQAQKKSLSFLENRGQIQKVRHSLTLRKQIPLHCLEGLDMVTTTWDDTPITNQKEILWKLGFDTKSYKHIIDCGEYTWQQRGFFGEYIIGEERIDEEWIKMRVGGVRVASMEAQLKASGDEGLASEIRRLRG